MPSELSTKILRSIALFADLSADTLRRIANVSTLRTYAPESHIILAGEPCRATYFILRGEVRIYRVSREGREQVLVRLGPGQAFNTVPPFEDDGRNPANVMALEEVTLCVVLKDDFLRLVSTQADLSMAMLHDFAGRLSHLTDLVENLALRSVQGRLARFLLDHADEAERRDETEAITARWTQREIAVHLGTVRDMVGRGLRAFQDAGLIQIERGRIVLLDREALEEIAET